MARSLALRDYIAALKKADQKDDAAFKTLVTNGMDLMQLNDSDLSHHFGVSRPTVNRWRNGANAPLPTLRKHVYLWLKHRASALLNG